MPTLKILSSTKDLRTQTYVLYAQISITDYLNLVGADFDRFEIQRPRQNYKAYTRMQKDIENGALLPPITLAINPSEVTEYIDLWEAKNNAALIAKLYDSKNIYILDGLQRTYIINDLHESSVKFKRGQKLMLEIWLEQEIKHLIYRLIVLNAGQKPMSMRHQVELLFMTMQGKLTDEIPNLEILKEKDETRRSGAKKFPFDRIVTSYYCFLSKSPEEKRENLVVQQMNELEIFNSDEESLSESFFDFTRYFKTYVMLDQEVYRVYDKFSDSQIKSPKNWLAEDNVINSFFAAIAQTSTNLKLSKRVDKAIKRLLAELKSSKNNADPLALLTLSKIRHGINSRKENVGFATRRLLTNGFKEFFREEGELEMEECWRLADA